MKTVTTFDGERNFYSAFLNRAPTPFRYAGKRYLSVEHYLLVQKALYLEAPDLAARLLSMENADGAFEEAAMLYGPRERLWNMVLPHVALCGIRAKFQQHRALYQILRSTAGRMLVYTDESDPLWGTGCAIREEQLDGQCDGNLLGRLLMLARVQLKEWEKRGAFAYEDVKDHPEFFKGKVMRIEIDQLLDNVYTHDAVWPYVMVMAFPYGKKPFIPLTTLNLPPKACPTYATVSPLSLSQVQRPEAGYWEMVQELYDLYRLQFIA